MDGLYCNNSNCKHYDNQCCTAKPVYNVDRVCVTYRKRSRGDNYRELMQADSYRREHGAVKARDGKVLK
jgi:hypothetical protein